MSKNKADTYLNQKSDSGKFPLSPISAIFITLIYIVCVVSISRYNIIGIIPFFAYPIILYFSFKFPIPTLLKRAALALPLVLFAGIANLIFDTTFQAGLISFIVLLLKTLLCVSGAFILFYFVLPSQLAGALHKLKVPCQIVLQLMLTYRYIELLCKEAISIKDAYFLRNPNSSIIPVKDWAKLLSALLVNSIDKADGIYNAMVCRGFNARAIIAGSESPKYSEYIFIGIFLSICILIRFAL